VTRTVLLGLIASVFMVSGMSAEAKHSDDSSGLHLADNELVQSRPDRVGYIWSNEIRSDSTAPLRTLTANQSDEQVDSYYASDALVTVTAMGLAVIFLGGLALVGSALRPTRLCKQIRQSNGARSRWSSRKRPRQFRLPDAASPGQFKRWQYGSGMINRPDCDLTLPCITIEIWSKG
jgi:hypothetical protein